MSEPKTSPRPGGVRCDSRQALNFWRIGGLIAWIAKSSATEWTCLACASHPFQDKGRLSDTGRAERVTGRDKNHTQVPCHHPAIARESSEFATALAKIRPRRERRVSPDTAKELANTGRYASHLGRNCNSEARPPLWIQKIISARSVVKNGAKVL